MKYLRKFETIGEYNSFIIDKAEYPNVCLVGGDTIIYNMTEPEEMTESPLYIRAMEDMTFSLSQNNIRYSFDLEEWVELGANTPSPTIAKDTVVFLKGNASPTSTYGIGTFTFSGNCSVGGHVMSLLYGDDYLRNDAPDYAFFRLFEKASNLISARNLVLPSEGGLKTFAYMFVDCVNLIVGADIPVLSLGFNCCEAMYARCTSLKVHPMIAATTVGQYSCSEMFSGCTSLTETCELKPLTLNRLAYVNMYMNCSNLRLIKAYFTTPPSTEYTKNWVSGVAASGTFVKNAAATWNVTGVNGIPSGWTVETVTI